VASSIIYTTTLVVISMIAWRKIARTQNDRQQQMNLSHWSKPWLACLLLLFSFWLWLVPRPKMLDSALY